MLILIALALSIYPPESADSVRVIVEMGDEICIGGWLYPNNHLLCRAKSTWAPSSPAFSDTIFDGVTIGQSLYLGGAFTQVGESRVGHVVQWDGKEWRDLAGGVDGVVYDLATDGRDLYVGGEFARAGTVAAPSIARWDGTRWHSLGSGTDGVVYAIATSSKGVYVGGEFTSAGALTDVGNIALWDGQSWQRLGEGLPARVKALHVLGDGRLVAGGAFTATKDGRPLGYIAVWDGSSWQPLGAGLQDLPNAITEHNNRIYAIGSSWILKPNRGSIAVWDGAAWRAEGPHIQFAEARRILFHRGGAIAGYSGYQCCESCQQPCIAEQGILPVWIFRGELPLALVFVDQALGASAVNLLVATFSGMLALFFLRKLARKLARKRTA